MNIKIGTYRSEFRYLLRKADWIVEAVVERIDIKHLISMKRY